MKPSLLPIVILFTLSGIIVGCGVKKPPTPLYVTPKPLETPTPTPNPGRPGT